MIKLGIGKNLKKYRQMNNYTQEDVAKMLNVNSRTISSWEIDRTEPTVGMIEKLAAIYGCKKSDLVANINDIPDLAAGTGELLHLYSKASPDQQQAVLTLLRSMVSG